MDGPEFDTVTAQPSSVDELAGYLPQVRARSALAGALEEFAYATRVDVAIGHRARVLAAADLRTLVGLRPTQKLVLLLFGQDDILERLWNDRFALVPQMATAGYDLIIAPSYSTWTPRPRTEHLYNLKRSLIIYQELQRLGATAVPRLAWVTETDILRWAIWIRVNREVELVGLDWMTHRTDPDWQRGIEGLGLLDRLTGRRLRYLINGPTTSSRCSDIFTRVEPRRVCLTNSTLAPPAPHADPQLAVNTGGGPVATFARRCALQRGRIAAGARLAGSPRWEMATSCAVPRSRPWAATRVS